MKMSYLKRSICVLFASIYLAAFLCSCSSGSGTPEEDPYEYLKTDIVGMWMDENGPLWAEDALMGGGYQFYEFTSDGKMIYHHLYKDKAESINDGFMVTAVYRIHNNKLYLDPPSEEDMLPAVNDEDVEFVDTQPADSESADETSGEETSPVSETTAETTSVSTEDPNADNKASMDIEIKDGILTMSNEGGEARYTKLTVEESTAYLLYYQDKELAEKQKEYMNKLVLEEEEKNKAEGSAAESDVSDTPDASSGETSDVTAETDVSSEETVSETE